jgi:hypothetical protein
MSRFTFRLEDHSDGTVYVSIRRRRRTTVTKTYGPFSVYDMSSYLITGRLLDGSKPKAVSSSTTYNFKK